MSDINAVAAIVYADGVNPIDWAAQLATNEIDVRDETTEARRTEPGAFPGYRLALDSGAVARRIVGALLDAGWTPPVVGPLLGDPWES